MDVEFTVELIKEKSIKSPRVETADYLMTVGLAGSVDDALKQATGAMGQWITADYQLTPSETAQVLGTAIEYRIAEVADRNAGVVAKIRKERLAG
jgi:amidase